MASQLAECQYGGQSGRADLDRLNSDLPRDDFPFVTGRIVALPRKRPGICWTCWVLKMGGRVLKAAWKEKASVPDVVWVTTNE